MITLEVDWSAAGGQNSGAGSGGDPYGSILYALQQQFAAEPSLSVMGGLTINVTDSSNTGCPANDEQINLQGGGYAFTNSSTTNFVTIRAADNKRPTAFGPQLDVDSTVQGTVWNIGSTGACVDGFKIRSVSTLGANPILITSANFDSIKVRNCWLEATDRSFSSSAQHVVHHTNAVIENCVFVGGRTWIGRTNASSSLIGKNNTFIRQHTSDGGVGAVRLGASCALYSCAFYSVQAGTPAVQTGITGSNNAIDATSTPGEAGIFSVSTLTTADFNDHAGGDYRPAAAGLLIGAGDPSNSTATDMFGNTRSDPSIGFSEAPGGGAGDAEGAGVEATASASTGSAEEITASLAFTGDDIFIDETGAPVASATLTVYIWHAARPTGAPDQILSGQVVTDGELTLDLNPGTLEDEDPIFFMAFAADGTDLFAAGERTVTVT